jgi:hypothetical protein
MQRHSPARVCAPVAFYSPSKNSRLQRRCIIFYSPCIIPAVLKLKQISFLRNARSFIRLPDFRLCVQFPFLLSPLPRKGRALMQPRGVQYEQHVLIQYLYLYPWCIMGAPHQAPRPQHSTRHGRGTTYILRHIYIIYIYISVAVIQEGRADNAGSEEAN